MGVSHYGRSILGKLCKLEGIFLHTHSTLSEVDKLCHVDLLDLMKEEMIQEIKLELFLKNSVIPCSFSQPLSVPNWATPFN